METMEGDSEKHIDFDLLAAFLAGECTLKEIAAVEKWLAESPENQKTLDQLGEIWNAEPSNLPFLNVDAAWNNVKAQIHTDEIDAEPAPKRLNSRSFFWISAAAMLILAIGLVWRFLPGGENGPVNSSMMAFESGAEMRIDTLPDGTVIHLNQHSRLEYPTVFAGNERLVKLEGEAFFDVAHNPAKPFRILAGESEVRVIGTSFNLSTKAEKVKVSVQSGKVEFGKQGIAPQKKVLLTKGMAAELPAASEEVKLIQNDVENDLYWKTRKLVFKRTPLLQVVGRLNTLTPDTVVTLDSPIESCPFTSTFEKSSIASIVRVIAATFDFEVTQNENTYQISGQACQ